MVFVMAHGLIEGSAFRGDGTTGLRFFAMCPGLSEPSDERWTPVSVVVLATIRNSCYAQFCCHYSRVCKGSRPCSICSRWGRFARILFSWSL